MDDQKGVTLGKISQDPIFQWMVEQGQVVDGSLKRKKKVPMQNVQVEKKPTHIWWQKDGLRFFHFQDDVELKLLAQIAHLLSHQKENKLIEVCTPERKNRFWLDIDIRLPHEISKEKAILFLNDLVCLMLQKGHLDQALAAYTRNESLRCLAVTMSNEKFQVSSDKKTQWKLGAHLIWPGVYLSLSDAKKEVMALTHRLEALHPAIDAVSGVASTPIWMKEVFVCSTRWSDIIDIEAVLSTQRTTLRTVYSVRQISCRQCRIPKPHIKQHHARKVQEKIRQNAHIRMKKQAQKRAKCTYCRGSGLEPTRPHSLSSMKNHQGKALTSKERKKILSEIIQCDPSLFSRLPETDEFFDSSSTFSKSDQLLWYWFHLLVCSVHKISLATWETSSILQYLEFLHLA